MTVLAHAGKPGPARALGHGLLHRPDELGAPPARRVELLLVLVRAALAAGDTDSATADVASARAAGDLTGPDQAERNRHDIVLYDLHNAPVWASNTAGSPGAYLAIQDDGNTVVYRKDGHPLWATNTG